MLKKRIITTFVLILFIMVLILWPPDFKDFIILSPIFFLIGAFEWARLAGVEFIFLRIVYLLVMPLLYFVLYYLSLVDYIFLITLGFWIFAVPFFILRYPRDSKFLSQKYIGLIIGVLILVPGWAALIDIGPDFILYILTLVLGAKIGGYFIGKYFRKHKFIPSVGSEKTVEGVIGTLVTSIIIAGCAYALLSNETSLPLSSFEWVGLSLITVVFSIVGDLFESLFKHLRNFKHSGNLLPGYGGLLDCIAGLIAAIPIFAVGVMLLS